MLSDIDRLVKYNKLLRGLHELKNQLGGEGVYDDIEIKLPSPMVIREKWYNTEGKNAKTYEFTFSQIDDITERIRKKIDYRKIKIAKLAEKKDED